MSLTNSHTWSEHHLLAKRETSDIFEDKKTIALGDSRVEVKASTNAITGT